MFKVAILLETLENKLEYVDTNPHISYPIWENAYEFLLGNSARYLAPLSVVSEEWIGKSARKESNEKEKDS